MHFVVLKFAELKTQPERVTVTAEEYSPTKKLAELLWNRLAKQVHVLPA
jgi:hypothetical protein